MHGLCLASSLFAQEGVSGQCKGASSALEPEVHTVMSHAVHSVAAHNQYQQQQPEQDRDESQGPLGSQSCDVLPCVSGPGSLGSVDSGQGASGASVLCPLGCVHAQGLVYASPGVRCRWLLLRALSMPVWLPCVLALEFGGPYAAHVQINQSAPSLPLH